MQKCVVNLGDRAGEAFGWKFVLKFPPESLLLILQLLFHYSVRRQARSPVAGYLSRKVELKAASLMISHVSLLFFSYSNNNTKKRKFFFFFF